MANYPGCDTCVVQKKLGTAGSWNIYGQDGLIDFNAYYLRPDKNITLTPLCISKGNCSVPLYGFSTWSGQSWWGKDMTATYSVSNITAYTSAVSVLRSWPGHNISNAGAWLYGPPYAMIEFWNRQADTSGFHPEVAAAPASIINITYATLGFRPLVVSHVGCGSFYFSTLDPTNSSYWNEHWELYKFTYASAQWLWKNNITKVELHNEADLSKNNACMNPVDPDTIKAASDFNTLTGSAVTVNQFVTLYWADHVAVGSVAFQDAYADANADVANKRMACPFPGVCPVKVNIYGSAYALSLGDPAATPTVNQLAGAALQNAYFRFPCTAATCTLSGNWNATSKPTPRFPWGTDTSFSTFQIYSYHSYGNSGDALFTKGNVYTNFSVGFSNVAGTSAAAVPWGWKGPQGGAPGSTNQFVRALR